MEIKEIVKTLIDDFNLTQQNLADVSGLSRGRISHIYSSDDDVKISCAYESGVKLRDLLDEKMADVSSVAPATDFPESR